MLKSVEYGPFKTNLNSASSQFGDHSYYVNAVVLHDCFNAGIKAINMVLLIF